VRGKSVICRILVGMTQESSGAVFELTAHVVFVTKYRRKVFTAEILDRCETIISDVAATIDVDIMEINGESDHLHLLISYPPKVSISMIAGRLKGSSSRILRQEFGPQLRKQLWGDSLWTDSYFAASTGGARWPM
jgi:putative transposase